MGMASWRFLLKLSRMVPPSMLLRQLMETENAPEHRVGMLGTRFFYKVVMTMVTTALMVVIMAITVAMTVAAVVGLRPLRTPVSTPRYPAHVDALKTSCPPLLKASSHERLYKQAA